MKSFYILFLSLIIFNCSNKLDSKISSKDSHKILDEICLKLSSSSCEKLRWEYKYTIARSQKGKEGLIAITLDYGIRYNDLSFNDLLNHINKEMLSKDKKKIEEVDEVATEGY